MPAHCQLTGVKVQYGNHNSHARNKVRRRFAANLQKRTLRVSQGDCLTLTLSTKGRRLLDSWIAEMGMPAAVQKVRALLKEKNQEK